MGQAEVLHRLTLFLHPVVGVVECTTAAVAILVALAEAAAAVKVAVALAAQAHQTKVTLADLEVLITRLAAVEVA